MKSISFKTNKLQQLPNFIHLFIPSSICLPIYFSFSAFTSSHIVILSNSKELVRLILHLFYCHIHLMSTFCCSIYPCMYVCVCQFMSLISLFSYISFILYMSLISFIFIQLARFIYFISFASFILFISFTTLISLICVIVLFSFISILLFASLISFITCS